MLPFKFLPVQSGGAEPIWDGHSYRIGDQSFQILDYCSSQDGWRDDLTTFIEETAGSDHFIDIASREHALAQVKKFVKAEQPVILEVGCSSGLMLSALADFNRNGFTLGADVIKEHLQQLTKNLPGTPLLQFDLTRCPLPDNCVDAVVLLNVLEHIENDRVAIEQLFRILKPNGVAILEVPAGPELYDSYDRIMMHYRRYRMKEFRQLVTKAGFKIEYASHLGCFLYPGFWLVKKIARLRTQPDCHLDLNTARDNIKKTRHNKLLKIFSDLEIAFGKTVNYPFGIRCLITASKPDQSRV